MYTQNLTKWLEFMQQQAEQKSIGQGQTHLYYDGKASAYNDTLIYINENIPPDHVLLTCIDNLLTVFTDKQGWCKGLLPIQYKYLNDLQEQFDKLTNKPEYMIQKFQKKPVVIEAIYWSGHNVPEIIEFVGKGPLKVSRHPAADIEGIPVTITIPTLEGPMVATEGDFIIRGVKGECYPCSEEKFRNGHNPLPDGKWEKRPVQVDAVQWMGTNEEQLTSFVGEGFTVDRPLCVAIVPNQRGSMRAGKGDWVLSDGKSFWVCEGEIFEMTYEKVDHAELP